MTEAHETILKPAVPAMPWGLAETPPNGGTVPGRSSRSGHGVCRDTLRPAQRGRGSGMQMARDPGGGWRSRRACRPPRAQVHGCSFREAKPLGSPAPGTSHGPSVSRETRTKSVKHPDTCLFSFWPLEE